MCSLGPRDFLHMQNAVRYIKIASAAREDFEQIFHFVTHCNVRCAGGVLLRRWTQEQL